MKSGYLIQTFTTVTLLALLMCTQAFSQSMNQVATYTDITHYQAYAFIEGEVDVTESYVLYSHTYAISSTMYSPGYTRSNTSNGSHSSAPTWGSNGLDILTQDGTFRLDISIEQWCDYAQQFSLIAGGTYTFPLAKWVRLAAFAVYNADGTVELGPSPKPSPILSGIEANDKLRLRGQVTISDGCVAGGCTPTVTVAQVFVGGTPDVVFAVVAGHQTPQGPTTMTFDVPTAATSFTFMVDIKNNSLNSEGIIKFDATLAVVESTVTKDPPTTRTSAEITATTP
ncbi:MAG: hypothetical protein KF868_13330 [Acidobacteria bacterium]|nr:hypothetical protein [Acidobacteriota bacterium]MCW5970957.1 hypothetical protein [Blastocatellales bacterium]